MNIQDYLDSTYLKTSEQSGLSEEETWQKVKSLTQEAIEHSFCAVMIRPKWVKKVSEIIENHQSKVLLGTVISFPEGDMDLGDKLSEAKKALEDGADELDFVINYALREAKYQQLLLIGFSLGGNMTLKFLGEKADALQKEIIGAVTFSVPLDLHGSCTMISRKSNFIYSYRFLRHLKKKVQAKSMKMPEQLTMDHFSRIRTLTDFDDLYTAPLHGFKDALTYYNDSSSLPYLNAIRVPTLIVNAKNDPFLSEKCYPEQFTREGEFVKLEIPAEGGHCGFPEYNVDGLFWSEKRALAFAEKLDKKD